MNRCGLVQETSQVLYCAVDTEGHRGLDNRLYMLDFARVICDIGSLRDCFRYFPAKPQENREIQFKGHISFDYFDRVQKTFIFSNAIEEFVRSYKKPLCSDVFSKFIGTDPEAKVHQAEVKEATDFLLGTVVPNFAPELIKLMKEAEKMDGLGGFGFTEILHSKGINVRHLGINYYICV